ncbi:MAG: hypothetical protein KBT34_03295 [Prevotella sp.]|nr:hypothetical protein [Candidatus Prevotella equi]
MKKSLLIGLMAVCTSLSSFALEVGEYVYTPQGRFQISGENECSNGTFASGFDGWTVLSAEEEKPAAEDLFLYDEEVGCIKSLKNACTEGIYYKFSPTNAKASYVISFKVRQQTPTYPFCTNAYYKFDGDKLVIGAAGNMANAAGLNDVNVFGNAAGSGITGINDFVKMTKGFNLPTEWEVVAFATPGDEKSRDYYITFAGMNTTVEIADVEIHEATEVGNIAKLEEVVGRAKMIAEVTEWEDMGDAYDELIELIEAGDEVIAEGEGDASDVNKDIIRSLEEVMETFYGKLDNYITSCKSRTDWRQGYADTRKFTSLGDWDMSASSPGARWFQKNGFDCTDAIHAPSFGYGNGGRGTQTMQMKKNLAPGTYIFTLNGSQRNCYNGNGHYWSIDGLVTGKMELAIVNADDETIGATTAVAPLPTPVLVNQVNEDYATGVVAFEVKEEGDYIFRATFTDNFPEGITDAQAKGGSFIAQAPRIFVKLAGKYNAAQLAYEENVRAQIQAAQDNVAKAQENLANTEKSWGKAALQTVLDATTPEVEKYAAMSQDEIIATYAKTYVAGPTNENALLEHEVYVNAAQPLIDANRAFDSQNAKIESLLAAIENVEKNMNLGMYDFATGKPALVSIVDDAKATYAALVADDYSEENATTVDETIKTLNEAFAALRSTIPADKVSTVLNIDFSKGAKLNEETGNYELEGEGGMMEVSSSLFVENSPIGDSKSMGTMNYELGIDQNGEKVLPEVLRVGQGDATIDLSSLSNIAEEEGVVVVSADFWFIRLSDSYTGFYLKDENGANVSGLHFRAYNNDADYNPCEMSFADNFVPSNTNGDVASYTEDNKTNVEIMLDYRAKVMIGTLTSPKGVRTSEAVPFDGAPVVKFVMNATTKLSGGKSYIGRRSWADNIKVVTYATDPTAVYGVTENGVNVPAVMKKLVDGKVLIETVNGTFNVGGVQVK